MDRVGWRMEGMEHMEHMEVVGSPEFGKQIGHWYLGVVHKVDNNDMEDMVGRGMEGTGLGYLKRILWEVVW